MDINGSSKRLASFVGVKEVNGILTHQTSQFSCRQFSFIICKYSNLRTNEAKKGLKIKLGLLNFLSEEQNS